MGGVKSYKDDCQSIIAAMCLFSKCGELVSLMRDQIVLGLPPTDGDTEIIVRTGIFCSAAVYMVHFVLPFRKSVSKSLKYAAFHPTKQNLYKNIGFGLSFRQ